MISVQPSFAMKPQLILIVVCATAISGYHRTIGIPAAEEIRHYEDTCANSRIAHGALSMRRLHPFFGGLIVGLASNLTSVCGSTLLTSTKLLTAAHCWDDGEEQGIGLIVVLGSVRLFSGGTRILTGQVETHYGYKPNTIENDIAMITVPKVQFNADIKPISLPKGALLESTYEGVKARVVGYGVTSDTASIDVTQSLRYAIVTVRHDECKVYGQYFTGAMICTNTMFGGPCGGDSGGPLFVYGASYRQKYLIGVVSYGSPIGCNVGYPTVYTRVGSYIDWIYVRIQEPSSPN